MLRGLRIAAPAAVLAMSLVVGVAPALAAAPSNDTYGDAVTIASLPFDATVDTSEATTDATDAEANAVCGAPVTLGSVWYDYTPSVDAGFIVDVSQSSYEAGVIVVSGEPGAFTLETCGPFTVGFYGVAGVTYHIVAFSDTPGVNGGTLVFHMEVAPPPPELSISLDKVGRFDPKTGVATLTGSWSCSGETLFTEIDTTLSQRVGRFTINGSSYIGGPPCDGGSYRWTAEVYPENGRFAGGKAAAVTFAYACGVFECSLGYAEQRVQLRR